MEIKIRMGRLFGKFALASMDNADPKQLLGPGRPMKTWLVPCTFPAERLLIAFSSKRQPNTEHDDVPLDKAGVSHHWMLSAVITLPILAGTGAALSGLLFPLAFREAGERLPSNLSDLAQKVAHGLASNLPVPLGSFHDAAALSHQFSCMMAC